jgi:glycosyltransferase involved in cell wall biosynthesis
MKVALDAQLTIGTATGIGEYVRGLIEALARTGVEPVALREARLDPWRFDRRVLWDQVLLPWRARASGARLLHCAAGTMPLRAAMPVVVTVHDLAWHAVQEHAPAYARYYFGPYSLQRYRRAAAIVADSNYSRDALLAALDDYDPARVRVVYPGVAADFIRLTRGAGDGRTILAVGTVERRKNLELLIRVLPHLPQARLVAIGPHTPYADVCRRLARDLGVERRVELRGYIEREQLLALYRNCAVAAVPSLYEGFGYAAAQALCSGVPCVVSNRTSLPEVAGDGAAVVDACDPGAWIAPLRDGLAGALDTRARWARPGSIARFSWETSAQSIEQIYRASVDG